MIKQYYTIKHNIKHEFDQLWGESLITDPGIVSLIQAQPHTFLEIAWLWNNFYDHYLPSPDPRRAAVIYKWKYVH